VLVEEEEEEEGITGVEIHLVRTNLLLLSLLGKGLSKSETKNNKNC
jgi:hypothetical protein